MNENLLAKLFEHNNWANQQTLAACSSLTDAQLDAHPVTATKGSIRRTLEHLAGSQEGYASYLLGTNIRSNWETAPSFAAISESLTRSGSALLALVQDQTKIPSTRLQTRDNFWVEPWVLIVQIINHAHEHREQISSMLTALGITPPEFQGWMYGEVGGALVPMSSS
jgi:uncharacterized damage-inducible protein DinB